MIKLHPDTPFCGSGTPDTPPEPLYFLMFPRSGAPGPQEYHLTQKRGSNALFNGILIISIKND